LNIWKVVSTNFQFEYAVTLIWLIKRSTRSLKPTRDQFTLM